MNFSKSILLLIAGVGLIMSNSCRKETCKIRSKHPDKLIQGTYKVTVSRHSSAIFSNPFDTILGSSWIVITSLGDGDVEFQDKQLTTVSNQWWGNTYEDFIWGYPFGNHIIYDCENDYIKVGLGSSGTSHSSFTYWEGPNISH